MADDLVYRCGACTACCKTHEVFEIEKPAGAWCPHCDVGVGCRVYETRPAGCREFQCEWIKSGFGERPDHTHAVLDFITEGAFDQLLMIFEAEEGALCGVYVGAVREQCLCANIPVCYVYLHGVRELFLPNQFVLTDELREQVTQEGIRVCEI